jgi:serine/threonine protein kinase
LYFNGKENNNNKYALKCIKYPESIDLADRDGYVSGLNSDYLVKYYETFTFNNEVYVVMKYFKNENLSNFIKQYQKKNQKIEEEVYFYFI